MPALSSLARAEAERTAVGDRLGRLSHLDDLATWYLGPETSPDLNDAGMESLRFAQVDFSNYGMLSATSPLIPSLGRVAGAVAISQPLLSSQESILYVPLATLEEPSSGV